MLKKRMPVEGESRQGTPQRSWAVPPSGCCWVTGRIPGHECRVLEERGADMGRWAVKECRNIIPPVSGGQVGHLMGERTWRTTPCAGDAIGLAVPRGTTYGGLRQRIFTGRRGDRDLGTPSGTCRKLIAAGAGATRLLSVRQADAAQRLAARTAGGRRGAPH